MILGIGTDICDITRIEEMIEKFGQRFLDKTFTSHEQSYCEPKSSNCLLYTSPSPRDQRGSRMPSSA